MSRHAPPRFLVAEHPGQALLSAVTPLEASAHALENDPSPPLRGQAKAATETGDPLRFLSVVIAASSSGCASTVPAFNLKASNCGSISAVRQWSFSTPPARLSTWP